MRGKVVLVTGASGGIGASIALFYAKAGAAVTIVARKQETLDETKALIEGKVPDARVLTVVVDVRDPVQAEKAVGETVKLFGRLDVLIANAGMASPFTQSKYFGVLRQYILTRDQSLETKTRRFGGMSLR